MEASIPFCRAQAFVLRAEPIDARRQHRLDGGRYPDRLDR
jgi:hypothetical protein